MALKKIKLEILGLSSSQSQTGSFALVLGEAEGNRRLPIIIGMFEAQAIAIEIEKIIPNRPMTHDLFKSFANAFNFENSVSYNKVFSSPGWTDYTYSGTLEWGVTQMVEPVAQIALAYTKQTDSYNSFEVRPVIGCRFYLSPARRIQTRLLLRFEDRLFKKSGDR